MIHSKFLSSCHGALYFHALLVGAFFFINALLAVEIKAPPIKIALVAPFSGPLAPLGFKMKQAAFDAVKVINDAGGLLNQKIEVEFYDDECSPSIAINIALKLASDPQICAVIGHCPNVFNDVAAIYNKRKIFISTLIFPRDYYRYYQQLYSGTVFVIGFSEDRLGEAAGNAIWNYIQFGNFPEGTIGIIMDGSTSGRIIADVVERELGSKSGVHVVFKSEVQNPSQFNELWDAYHPQILFFSIQDPTSILDLLEEKPHSAKIFAVGVPFSPDYLWETPDYLWEIFWRWAKTSKTDAYVIAPSLTGHMKLGAGTPGLDDGVFRIWKRRADLTSWQPSLPQIYVLAAFDLLIQAIIETKSINARDIQDALRKKQRSTLLGYLSSGELGEIRPIPYEQYGNWQSWTPSTAFELEYGRKEAAKENNGEPEYNIEIEPKQARDPLVLNPDVETRIKFFIGPQSDESLTPGIKPGDTFKQLAAGGPLDLTVTLFCNLSETNTYQQRRIVYDPVKKRSESPAAEFVIIPSLAAVRDNDGVGRLIFVIDANGMEVDIIQVNAIVGEPTTAALEKYRRPAKLRLDNILPEDISVSDLIIAVAPQAAGKIPIVIRPMNSELLQRLQEELNDQENSFWVFNSGVNARDLEGLVADAYKELLAISDQNQKGLQETYKQIGIETEMSGQVSFGSFDKADTDKILGAVSRRGRLLYGRIFRGDENLLKAMKVINSFDLGRPLRLKVLAEDIYVPWQILYPDFQNSLEAKQFWGFRYELGTLQLANQAHGRTRTVISNLRPGEVLYGAWRGVADNTGDDEVKELANLLKEHLEKSIGTDIQFCPSKADFLSKIESGAKTIKIILAYGHGSSGTVLLEYADSTGNKSVITVSSALGPYFKFAEGDNETLVPGDIDYLALPYIDDSIYPYLFKSQPIVILNACETGTSGTRSPDNNGFVGALARAGSRAIIVTEAPVGGNFAYVFGQQIIDSLLDGDEAQSAMLKVRLKHLEKAGNPLGLLYSLYGNPAARIKRD